MAAPTHSPLLVDPPPGRHIVQIHRTSDALVDAAAFYLAEGLRRNDPVVAMVQGEHEGPLRRRLGPAGDRVVFRGAEACLGRFMDGERPDAGRFRDMIRELLPPGPKAPRVYGELVGLLWHRHRSSAALALERLWNGAVHDFRFRLFSCYRLDSHDPGTYREPIHEIGTVPLEVVPTADDERLFRALQLACTDLFGFPLHRIMEPKQEGGLPEGPAAMVWVLRHMPGSSQALFRRTREILDSNTA